MATTSNRTEHLSLRITKDERIFLKEKAKKYNLTLTDFILQCTLKEELENAHNVNEAVKEIHKIGVNINQFVRAMHRQGLDQNQIDCINKEMKNIWHFLKQLQAKPQLDEQ